MTDLPAHIHATTETTLRYRCEVCGSRLILGRYPNEPARAGRTLARWLGWHRHGAEQEPL